MGTPLLAHDALSRLLLLHPVRTELDTRCRFNAPWKMIHKAEKPFVAPYHLVVEGEALVDIEGRESITLRAGDVLVFPHGHAHRLYTMDAVENSPMHPVYKEAIVTHAENTGVGPLTEILCGQFHFEAPGSKALVDALPDVIHISTAGRHEFLRLQALVSLLRDETNEALPGASAVVSHLASALLLLLLRAWLEQAHVMPGMFALLADPRLSQALHGILTDPGKPWTLEELANHCQMSRATFVRLFPSIAGTTPGDLLMRVRMIQAGQWLSRTRMSIGEICDCVGYRSEAAFNRAFKRFAGVGPGQYRRQHSSYVGGL
ncbi:AraC family transcriptional regulator [Pseudomonas sp. RIT-PI-q]|uniref:AraC family transcriptional regulator n=1 Tax=Pseudomonas sp. RIT-PI-q TaxID=1690247 RepID=UPI0009EBAB40|nr:AraC family transcriptional regulator [Pseudomonas sp. RIT-PI-q]